MKRKFIFIFSLTGCIFLLTAIPVRAQVLSLSPASGSKTTGTEFAVDVNIDTGGKAVAGADVKLTFDPLILEVVSVEKGTFFTDGANNITSGNLYVAGFFPAQFETKTGTGKVATITLKGKKAGTAELNFVCTTQTVDTNILDSSSNDIAVCSKIINASYTIAAAAGGEDEPAPTPVPEPTDAVSQAVVPTATRTPPVSGTTLPTFFSFGLGMILVIAGLGLTLAL